MACPTGSIGSRLILEVGGESHARHKKSEVLHGKKACASASSGVSSTVARPASAAPERFVERLILAINRVLHSFATGSGQSRRARLPFRVVHCAPARGWPRPVERALCTLRPRKFLRRGGRYAGACDRSRSTFATTAISGSIAAHGTCSAGAELPVDADVRLRRTAATCASKASALRCLPR
jgi:hypothetical protein